MCPSFEQLPHITQPHLAQLHLLEEQYCSVEEPLNPTPGYLVQKYGAQLSLGDNAPLSIS